MRVVSVLVVSGGGFQGHALIKALRERPDVRVVLADCYLDNVSRYFADRFVQTPMLDEPERFLAVAFELCKREDISAIFAATDFELDLLARHRGLFQALGATVFVSDAPLLTVARDKRLFYRWLQQENLPALPCFDTPKDAAARFPLFGKPRRGWGSRDTQVVRSLDAFRALGEDRLADFIWQPLLEGFKEYSVDFAVDVEGRTSPLGVRRRVRTLGGFAILGETAEDPRIPAIAERAIDRMLPLGARGPMNLQLLATGEGCWISDLNPRVGTSMPLSLVAGHNPVTFLLGSNGYSARRRTVSAHQRTLRTLEEMCIPTLTLTLSAVRGIVFDLDDTLVDQKKWILQKLRMTWQRAQRILPDESRFLTVALRILEEGNRARMFDAVCAELGHDESVVRQLIAAYRESVPEHCELYDDVLPCLDQLRRLGYKLGLMTDNPPVSQQQKLDRSGLRDCFDALVMTEDIGAPKPDPRGFVAISDRLGLPSTQLVMVGDNLFRDVQASIHAGFAHAFHVQRKGAFFNFSTESVSEAIGLSNFTVTTRLSELLWHLSGTSSDE